MYFIVVLEGAAVHLLDADLRRVLLHQALSHQQAPHAGLLQHVDVVDGEDAALAHHSDAPPAHLVAQRPRHQVHRHVQAHLEGAQVAVVDAQQLDVVQLQHALHLLVRVHLDEGRHAHGLGDLLEVHQVLVGQHGGDEQNGVRAVLAGQVDLVGVHDELLAQQRAGHAGGADELQVLEAPLEELFVGEHGQARRAARLVRLADLDRVEVGLDHALAGGRLLDLGDERGLPRGLKLLLDGPHEVARGRRQHHGGAHQLQRELLLAPHQLLVLGPHDLLQDVARLVVRVLDALAVLVDGFHLEGEPRGAVLCAHVVHGQSVGGPAPDGHLGHHRILDGRPHDGGHAAARGGGAGGGRRHQRRREREAESSHLRNGFDERSRRQQQRRNAQLCGCVRERGRALGW
mmetsp:Transcript_734/g.1695  ORF Transcript_734/g.1695 Transcript_734/m.1695 type:complete len:402 (+) Transcript_734:118-1323(+)